MEPSTTPKLTINDLNDDVLHVIAEFLDISVGPFDRGISAMPIKTLSLVSRRLRDVTMPFLFRSVIIQGPKGRSRLLQEGDWESGLRAISDLEVSIVQHIKALKFDIYASEYPEKPIEPGNMARVVKFLSQIPKLRELVIYIPRPHVAGFLEELSAAELKLDTVETLVVNPFLISMLDVCPNADALAIHIPHYGRGLHAEPRDIVAQYRSDLISTLSRAKNLKHIDAHAEWGTNDIHDLHRALPNLIRITMRGGSYDGYASPLADIIDALSRFPHLKHLDLEDAANLGLGFDGGPWCGNAFDGPHGEQTRQQVFQQERDAQDVAGKMAFEKLEGVREVWVGRVKGLRAAGEEGRRGEFLWCRGVARRDLER